MGGWLPRRFVASGIAALTALGIMCATGSDAATSTTYTLGYDLSWPQCSGSTAADMPRSTPSYLILGLTDGGGDTVNPCLADQVAWANARGVPIGAYVVPSWPTTAEWNASTHGRYGACTTSTACRLHNVGANQGDAALATLRTLGLRVPMIWLDVEFRTGPAWSRDNAADNRDVVEGTIASFAAAGMPYGVYSTSYMWTHIVGHWTLDVPNWYPAGSGRASDARAKCAATATGGRSWIVQYVGHFDTDLTCPVMDAVPGRPGPLWPYRTTVLRLGDSGAAVGAAQSALGLPSTGSFGAAMLATVLRFQAAKGLTPSGAVDVPTWRALGAYRLYGGHPFLLSRVATRQ